MAPDPGRRFRPARLVAFVALAYGLSWACWIPLALTGTVVEAGQGWPTHLPGLLGPAVAAVVVTAATEGRRGLRELGRRMVRWRVRWVWSQSEVSGTGSRRRCWACPAGSRGGA